MTLHHSEETHQLLVDRVPDATGKPMKDWFALVEQGPSFTRFEDRVNWLRDEHDLSARLCHGDHPRDGQDQGRPPGPVAAC
jgi:hypothetical protein